MSTFIACKNERMKPTFVTSIIEAKLNFVDKANLHHQHPKKVIRNNKVVQSTAFFIGSPTRQSYTSNSSHTHPSQ